MTGKTTYRGIEIVRPDLPNAEFVWLHDETCTSMKADSVNLAICQIDEHLDNLAVDRFAVEMKTKLSAKRAEGYGGWDDPAACSPSHLSDLLRRHVDKGDPVDVANFAMMLQQRGHQIAADGMRPLVLLNGQKPCSVANMVYQFDALAEQQYQDAKAEWFLDANGFTDREWRRIKIGMAFASVLVGLAIVWWLA